MLCTKNGMKTAQNQCNYDKKLIFRKKKVATLVIMEPILLILRISEVLGILKKHEVEGKEREMR